MGLIKLNARAVFRLMVRFITCKTYDDSIPPDLMKGGRLLNNMPLTLETALLLSEAAFQHSVAGKNLNAISTA